MGCRSMSAVITNNFYSIKYKRYIAVHGIGFYSPYHPQRSVCSVTVA